MRICEPRAIIYVCPYICECVCMYVHASLKQIICSFNKSIKELEDLSPLPICLKVAWAAESRSHSSTLEERRRAGPVGAGGRAGPQESRPCNFASTAQ